MKITKRQLKRIIREEYSKLKRHGLIKESRGWYDDKHETLADKKFADSQEHPMVQFVEKEIGPENPNDSVYAERAKKVIIDAISNEQFLPGELEDAIQAIHAGTVSSFMWEIFTDAENQLVAMGLIKY